MTRNIVLCADDYGLSPGISRGIRQLLQVNRLSATSCMVVYPEFPADGHLLRPFVATIDAGLHFTLTRDRSLASVLAAGWLRRLSRDKVRRELQHQLDIFESVIGRPPHYIDGHQHVHLLPGVREIVAEAAANIGAYLRLTHEPLTPAMFGRPAPISSAYLSWASGPLARLAAAQGVRTNHGFRGVRSFNESVPFRQLFRKMIDGAADATIVMCHPGHADEALKARDPIHRQREEESAYLASDDFPRDLSAASLQLATFRAVQSG